MLVKAIRTGYYQHKRHKDGEEFELVPQKNVNGEVISAEKQFSPSWMEKVDELKIYELEKPKRKGFRGAVEKQDE